MKIKQLKHFCNNSGQALVEFAIILPLLFVLVFGIIEFGRYLYLKNSTTQAAREGARKAAVTSGWITSNNSTNIAAVKQYVITGSVISITTNNITITPTPPVPGEAISVIIKTSFSSVVPNLIPIFKNLTSIRASATMRYE